MHLIALVHLMTWSIILSYSSINLQFTGHRGMNDVTVAQGRVLFGALGIITDVRLCNEIRNAAICQKGAVKPLYK